MACRKKTFWAAGTGYGAGSRANTETWDAKSSEAAQAARDAELQGLLDSIAAAFGSELGSLELEQQIQQLDLGPGKPGAQCSLHFCLCDLVHKGVPRHLLYHLCMNGFCNVRFLCPLPGKGMYGCRCAPVPHQMALSTPAMQMNSRHFEYEPL